MEKIFSNQSEQKILQTIFSPEALEIYFQNRSIEKAFNFVSLFKQEKVEATLKYNFKTTLKKSIYNEIDWIEAIFYFYDYLKSCETDSTFLKSIAFIYSCEDYYYSEKNSMRLFELVNLMIKTYGFY